MAKEIVEPKTPGWYYSPNGSYALIFLLTQTGQWYSIICNGDSFPCPWEFIVQTVSSLGLDLMAPIGGLNANPSN